MWRMYMACMWWIFVCIKQTWTSNEFQEMSNMYQNQNLYFWNYIFNLKQKNVFFNPKMKVVICTRLFTIYLNSFFWYIDSSCKNENEIIFLWRKNVTRLRKLKYNIYLWTRHIASSVTYFVIRSVAQLCVLKGTVVSFIPQKAQIYGFQKYVWLVLFLSKNIFRQKKIHERDNTQMRRLSLFLTFG